MVSSFTSLHNGLISILLLALFISIEDELEWETTGSCHTKIVLFIRSEFIQEIMINLLWSIIYSGTQLLLEI